MSELPLPTASQLTMCKVGNGALAGIAGVSASFPLDLIKTQFQLHKQEFNGKFINAARGNISSISLLKLIRFGWSVNHIFFSGYQSAWYWRSLWWMCN